MHLALKQMVPCIQMCELVERTLASYLVQSSDTTMIYDEPADFSFDHAVVKGACKISWGITGTLQSDALEEADPNMWFASFFVLFQENDEVLLEIDYHPPQDIWEHAPTPRQATLILEVLRLAQEDPKQLKQLAKIKKDILADAVVARQLSTAQALEAINAFAKYLIKAPE